MNVGLEVRLGVFCVLEVNQTIEVKRDVVIVNLQITFKQVLFHGPLERDHIDILTQQLDLTHLTVKTQFGIALLREHDGEISVHVEVADILGGIGYRPCFHPVGTDITVKEIVTVLEFRS